MKKSWHALLETDTLLRVGVSFAFIYPAVSAWFNPYSWVGYFPRFLSDAVDPHQIILLHIFGSVEIIIAIWILSGRRIFIPALTASAFLFLIVLCNFNQMDVLFRDIPILLMSIILTVNAKNNKE